MNNRIREITHEDEVLKYDKQFKVVKVDFFDADEIEIERAELMNVEIDMQFAKHFNDDGTLDRTDAYIPVDLGRGKEKYQGNRLNLYFSMGKTLFNDGAMFLIELKSHDKDENDIYVFKLDSGKWVYQKDCNKINYNDITYKNYKLIDAEWIEVGDENEHTN